MRHISVWLAMGLALWVLLGPEPAAAAVAGSPDVSIEVGGDALRRGEVTDDLTSAPPSKIDLGPLPDGTDISAYSTFFAGAGELFSVSHSVTLGSVTARPRDVILWDGGSYSILFDGGVNGIPDGVAIDALTFLPKTAHLWLSFDSAVDVFGTVVRDADVVGGIPLALVFDASAAGVPPGMDVDAVSPAGGNGDDLLLSFDIGGTLGGVDFADEDVLRYQPTGNAWSLEVDASLVDAAWESADLDAIHVVPEPGFLLLLASGVSLLRVLSFGRKSREKENDA